MSNAEAAEAPKTSSSPRSSTSGLTVLQFVKDHLGWVVAIATVVGSVWVASSNNAIIKRAVDESAAILEQVGHLKGELTKVDSDLARERSNLTQLQSENAALAGQYAAAKQWIETLNLVKTDEKEVVPRVRAILELVHSDPDASKVLARVGERVGDLERRKVLFSGCVPVDTHESAQLQLGSQGFATLGPGNLVLEIPCKAGDYVSVLGPLTVVGGPSNVYAKLALLDGPGDLIGEAGSTHVAGWSNGTVSCIVRAKGDGTLKIGTRWRSDHPQGKANVGGILFGSIIPPPAVTPSR
jgi:hypothetical protein